MNEMDVFLQNARDEIIRAFRAWTKERRTSLRSHGNAKETNERLRHALYRTSYYCHRASSVRLYCPVSGGLIVRTKSVSSGRLRARVLRPTARVLYDTSRLYCAAEYDRAYIVRRASSTNPNCKDVWNVDEWSAPALAFSIHTRCFSVFRTRRGPVPCFRMFVE